MIGVITSWDILANPIVTIQCFGWRVFLKALIAGRRQTFLALLATTKPAEGVVSRLSVLINRCIALELGAKRIYTEFARRFADQPEAKRFFDALVEQEQGHADLLALCRIASGGVCWTADAYIPWEECLADLECRMSELEDARHEISSLYDALKMTIQMESSEVNRLFEDVLAACDSDFVRRLPAFQQAIEKHLLFIADQISELEPELEAASRDLSELHPQMV
jgi:hypothetical protein